MSYWPMPFRKSCRITVTNEGRRRVANLYYHVDWEKVPSLLPATAYFHARYSQALPAPADGKPYVFLDVKGRGFYSGKDPDPNVRMMAGSAIASIGRDAAPAVPALTAACSVKDEQVPVLRACASALGAIGSAAKPALPVLKSLTALLRVRWQAEKAIQDIEGAKQ